MKQKTHAIIALMSVILYSLLFYYKFKHFPINNYVYTLYLILIVGSLIYIWHGWII